MKNSAQRTSVVNFTSMANSGRKNNQLDVPDLTQNKTITDPITPELAQLTFKRLP